MRVTLKLKLLALTLLFVMAGHVSAARVSGSVVCKYDADANSVSIHPISQEIYTPNKLTNSVDIISYSVDGCSRRKINLEGAPQDIAFSPDGSRYYVTVLAELQVFDYLTDTLVARIVLPDMGYEVVITDYRAFITPLNSRLGIFLAKLDTNSYLYEANIDFSGVSGRGALELSPDRTRLFYADRGLRSLLIVLDISTRTSKLKIASARLGSAGISLAVDPIAGQFVSYADGSTDVHSQNHVLKLNAESLDIVAEFNTGNATTKVVEYSHDSETLYTVESIDEIKLWNQGDKKLSNIIPIHGLAHDLVESPSGEFLVAVNSQYIQVIRLFRQLDFIANDFDADGDSDLIWRHELSGETALWTMQDALVDQKLHLGVISDTEWKVISTGDFNADGHSDMLWRHASQGWTSLWTFNNGTIASKKSLGTISDLNWQIIAEGDFDGDGDTDLLWQHSVSGAMTEWVVDNSEVVGRKYLGAVSPADWSIVSADDFDDDRQSDLLWRNLGTGEIVLWSMSAGVVASKATVGIVPDMDWAIATTGDFNGDGNSDIIWHHNTGGWTSIWAMSGAAIASRSSLGTISKNDWTIEKLGDYDGDGDADLIWRGVNSGWVNVWQLQEGAVTAKNYVANVSSEWELQ